MISYLIYSTVCMGLVLLFYHAVLARDKIYQINRWYLLGGLLFSLVIPFIPIGIYDSLISISSNTEVPQISVLQVSGNLTDTKSVNPASYFEWITPLLLYLYGIVTFILSVRMILNLYRLQLESMKNPTTIFKGPKVVLVDKEVVPHTFWKTIFINKEQYEKEISQEVLSHELIHAKQNHTLDILIIEIVKTIFWFNPILYFYKKAVQINHEYIADDKVLSNGADIVDYQTLLLKMRMTKSPHYLSNSLNFNITKKRFKMMTLNNSTYRSYLKIVLIIPFFVILGITLGCEPTSLEDEQADNIRLELVDSETIKLNGKTVAISEVGTVFSNLSLDPKETLIDLKVYKSAPMGMIMDVQKVLRERGALKINYSTEQSNESQSNEAWRSEPKSKNILELYLNEEGQIIVNNAITSLSALNEEVKNFITDNGESSSLSENPVNAFIAIKTDKRTPHDTYMSVMDKILGVYDELRNQASLELFNKPFNDLEEGSAKRTKIEKMYPKKISIQDPSKT